MTTTTAPRGLVFPALEDRDIVHAVQFGDPVIGWRGDPNMWVATSDADQSVKVFGLDKHCNTYVACTVHPVTDPGWRHTLLRKLRDGDWQHPERFVSAEEHNAAHRANIEAKARDAEQACAEVLAWGIQRDIGTYVGGLSRNIFPVGGSR